MLGSKSVKYRTIGIFLITAILIIGIVAYFVVPVKAEQFPSYHSDSIFGNDGDNLLVDYVDSHITYDFVDNNFGEDTMLVITNGSGSSYYLGTWYFNFNSYTFPYGYEVLSAYISCNLDWHIVGGTGYFGSSSVLFELWDETSHSPVASDSINFENNSSDSGSLSFSTTFDTSLYYGHVYSIKLTVNLRWAVNMSNAALYLSNARCLQNLVVSGSTVPPAPTPTPTPTPTPFVPAPTPTSPPVPTLPPLDNDIPTVDPADFSKEYKGMRAIAYYGFLSISDFPWYPVIVVSLSIGAIGTLAGIFSVVRREMNK